MRIFLCILLISLNLIKIFAQDTNETKIKTEVVVESSKPNQQLQSFSSSYFTFDKIKLFKFARTNDVLSFFPGVYIRDYGGIGGIKTISLRGFSGTDAGILIDGVKINNQQNGLVDLTLIPINFFEKVEVHRGGLSFFSGNNSSAGIFNFSTHFPKNKKFEFEIMYGSFRSFTFNAQIPVFEFGNIKSSISLNFFSSKGNYPFSINNFGVEKIYRRQNSNVEQFSLLYQNSLNLSSLVSNLKILISNVNRGVPGPVLQNNIENTDAKMNDLFILINYSLFPIFNTDSSMNFILNLVINKNSFYDPHGIGFLLKKYRVDFLNRDLVLKFSYDKELNWLHLLGFIEYNYSSLSGDMLDVSAEKSILRQNFASGLSLTKSYFLKEVHLNIETASRLEIIPNTSTIFNYMFGFLLKDKNEILSIKLNTSSNFRLPTFNEMYYLNYGNTNLKPEKTYSYNIELSSKLFSSIEPSLSFFYNITSDKIISVPKSPIQWTAQNVSRTLARGIEFSLNWDLGFSYVCLNYTFNLTTDETKNTPTFGKFLIYTPRHLANSLINFDLPYSSEIILRGIYVGERYSLPDNSLSSLLKDYFVFDIIISKKIKINNIIGNFSFQVLNLFDKSYQVILNYPMPGRQFYVKLETKF